MIKKVIVEKKALRTEARREEKELFDQADQAAYGWAEASVPFQQAIGKAYTVEGFGARCFESMWKDDDVDGNDISIGYNGGRNGAGNGRGMGGAPGACGSCGRGKN